MMMGVDDGDDMKRDDDVARRGGDLCACCRFCCPLTLRLYAPATACRTALPAADDGAW
jgi:hypothetical protein